MKNAEQKTRREKQLSVLVDPEVLTKVKEFAHRDDRSLSSYINRVLKAHVDEITPAERSLSQGNN
jgi:predicted HicB family RNase H-like nuclease